jgi:hypothetical protein
LNMPPALYPKTLTLAAKKKPVIIVFPDVGFPSPLFFPPSSFSLFFSGLIQPAVTLGRIWLILQILDWIWRWEVRCQWNRCASFLPCLQSSYI